MRAVGIDKVAAEAGVAPTTLYRLFASKDDLVGEYVRRADRLNRLWFASVTEADDLDPREKILALIDGVFGRPRGRDQCRGCIFLMALTEFPDPELPAHKAAVEMKRWLRGELRKLTGRLAETAPVDDPAALADQIILVIEGTMASAQALGPDGPARQARAVAEKLLPEPRS